MAQSKSGIAQCAHKSRRPYQRPPARHKGEEISERGGAKDVYAAGEEDLSEGGGEGEWIAQDFSAADVLNKEGGGIGDGICCQNSINAGPD